MTGKSRSVFIKEAVPTEAVLCDYFIEEANQVEGWVCYPETGGFDVLLVHESGRQIGIEAKLQLNAKVAEQILPHHSCYATGNPGPDHRVVIVRNTTDANAGIARMLELLGVDVWEPWIGETYKRDPVSGEYVVAPNVLFAVKMKLMTDQSVSKAREQPHHTHSYPALFDWNPITRLEVPAIVPDVKAGIPAPIRLTPWKQAAVRVLALLRQQGFVTTKDIAREGCSPTIWTQEWLDRSPDQRGHWLETDRIPPLDQQLPELYELAVQTLAAQPQKTDA